MHVSVQHQIDFVFDEPTHKCPGIVHYADGDAEVWMLAVQYRDDMVMQHAKPKGFCAGSIRGPSQRGSGLVQLRHAEKALSLKCTRKLL